LLKKNAKRDKGGDEKKPERRKKKGNIPEKQPL